MDTNYRLDRAAALMAVGVFVLMSAAFAAGALWFSSIALGAIAAALILAALWLGSRPPVVLRLDADGYRSRLRFSSGRFAGTWADVEDAELAEGLLVLTTSSGTRAFPLWLVGGQRVQVLTSFNEHLNAAHGYRRWLG